MGVMKKTGARILKAAWVFLETSIWGWAIFSAIILFYRGTTPPKNKGAIDKLTTQTDIAWQKYSSINLDSLVAFINDRSDSLVRQGNPLTIDDFFINLYLDPIRKTVVCYYDFFVPCNCGSSTVSLIRLQIDPSNNLVIGHFKLENISPEEYFLIRSEERR